MSRIGNLRPAERAVFITLGLLLFANGFILEVNEVIATSGFVSRVGTEQILWVWAADMVVVILMSGAYSLVVDRMKRDRLAMYLMASLGVVYLWLYLLFFLGAPEWISYPLLTVVNDQQWIILPMLLWGLANDIFSTAEAKWLFPFLGILAFVGGILGNTMTAVVAQFLAGRTEGSISLLLGNAVLLVLMALVVATLRRRFRITTHQSRHGESILDTLREGAAFVREVRAYRFLTVAMILMGVGMNVIEYQMIFSAAQSYPDTSSLEAFYAMVRAARIVIMFGVQGLLAGWLLKKLGLKSTFALTPSTLLGALLIAFAWPTVVGAVVAEYLSRITLEGVDEPARRAFLGMVPDERRGRVSAFVDGYLYPTGSVLGCGLVGATVLLVAQGILAPEAGRILYFGIAIVCVLGALWAISRFHAYYDESMLNWRLKRRRRGSMLANLDL